MASQKRFNFGRAGTLFNRKTIKREFTKVVFEPTDLQLTAAKNWAKQVASSRLSQSQRDAVRGEFIQTVFVTVLGYTPYRAGETYTIATEETLGTGSVDTALGTFSISERTVLAPFELKGPNTHDLDAIMPGRNKSPVQQAWEYAIDAPGAKWVLVSNCAEIRLYAFGHGRELYETWDLGRLDDPPSTSGFGCSSARKTSSPAAPPRCSTTARTSKKTSPTGSMWTTRIRETCSFRR